MAHFSLYVLVREGARKQIPSCILRYAWPIWDKIDTGSRSTIVRLHRITHAPIGRCGNSTMIPDVERMVVDDSMRTDGRWMDRESDN